MSDTALFKIENLSQWYSKGFFRKKVVFEDFNLSFEKGKVYALLGRNGAGKTTLLNCMLGLLKAQKGSMIYKGQKITNSNIHNIMKEITSIPPSVEMFQNITPNNYIAYYKGLYDKWDESLEKKIKDITDFDWDTPFKAHSTGQKMQVIQLLALCACPELLILDEPLGVTDPVIRKYFYKTLVSLVAEKNTTVIIATHLINEVANLFDEAIILKYGKVVLTETMDNVYDSYRKFVLDEMPDVKVEGELGRLIGENALVSDSPDATEKFLLGLGVKFHSEVPLIEDIFEIFA